MRVATPTGGNPSNTSKFLSCRPCTVSTSNRYGDDAMRVISPLTEL